MGEKEIERIYLCCTVMPTMAQSTNDGNTVEGKNS